VQPVIVVLQQEIGISHVLASRQFCLKGAKMLYDLSAERVDVKVVAALVGLRNGQRAFAETVSERLNCIDYGADGYANLIRVPGYRGEVVCDPQRSFGRPIFVKGGARVEDVMARFQTGESIKELTEEFGVSLPALEDAVQIVTRRNVGPLP
jgi:uncharacterized protein (DUF433 family)